MGGTLVIGSRRSRLARVQAEWVGRALVAAWPEMRVEYLAISTAGDRDRSTPLPEIGGKGLFTENLERALRDGTIDLVVHSLKDLPTAGAGEPTIVAIPAREDARDVLVLRPELASASNSVAELPAGVALGTSSPRRAAQIRAHIPGVHVVPIRGNVETRLGCAERGEVDGVVLAAAGLRRLRLRPAGLIELDPPGWLPAPGQGALGVQGRRDDERVAAIAAAIDHAPTRAAVTAERTLLGRLEGGCHVPVAALGETNGTTLRLTAAVYPIDAGGPSIGGVEVGDVEDAVGIGLRLADRLVAAGAAQLLAVGSAAILDRPEAVRRFGPGCPGTVVFTNGCFDLLHDGHRSLLERARALGDHLVVGLNSDASVRRLKGPDRPATGFDERARALADLDAVNAVVPFEEDTPLGLIEALRPDVLVKGADYDRASVVGGDIVEARGGRVVLLPLVQGASTTSAVKDRPDSGDESP